MRKRPPLVNLAETELPYLTPKELAEYLYCDVRTILRMISQGTLHSDRVGRLWRIPTQEARRVFHAGNVSRETSSNYIA